MLRTFDLAINPAARCFREASSWISRLRHRRRLTPHRPWAPDRSPLGSGYIRCLRMPVGLRQEEKNQLADADWFVSHLPLPSALCKGAGGRLARPAHTTGIWHLAPVWRYHPERVAALPSWPVSLSPLSAGCLSRPVCHHLALALIILCQCFCQQFGVQAHHPSLGSPMRPARLRAPPTPVAAHREADS